MVDNIKEIKELARLLVDESEYYQALREEGVYTEEAIFEKAMEEAEEAIDSENEDNKVDSDDLMSKAIAECIQMDIDRGVEPNLD